MTIGSLGAVGVGVGWGVEVGEAEGELVGEVVLVVVECSRGGSVADWVGVKVMVWGVHPTNIPKTTQTKSLAVIPKLLGELFQANI